MIVCIATTSKALSIKLRDHPSSQTEHWNFFFCARVLRSQLHPQQCQSSSNSDRPSSSGKPAATTSPSVATSGLTGAAHTKATGAAQTNTGTGAASAMPEDIELDVELEELEEVLVSEGLEELLHGLRLLLLVDEDVPSLTSIALAGAPTTGRMMAGSGVPGPRTVIFALAFGPEMSFQLSEFRIEPTPH